MIFATNNKNKLAELKEIFKEYEIKSLKEAEISIDVVEDQDSFYGNALKKAKEIYIKAHEPVIADDSGLCIEALNDWPGVMTSRFMGKDASDSDRNNEILSRMKNIKNKKAKVVCTLIYYDGVNIIDATGELLGTITEERRGLNGFGFDDIFELKTGETLAELTSEEKNKVSARFIAAKALKQKLKL